MYEAGFIKKSGPGHNVFGFNTDNGDIHLPTNHTWPGTTRQSFKFELVLDNVVSRESIPLPDKYKISIIIKPKSKS